MKSSGLRSGAFHFAGFGMMADRGALSLELESRFAAEIQVAMPPKIHPLAR